MIIYLWSPLKFVRNFMVIQWNTWRDPSSVIVFYFMAFARSVIGVLLKHFWKKIWLGKELNALRMTIYLFHIYIFSFLVLYSNRLSFLHSYNYSSDCSGVLSVVGFLRWNSGLLWSSHIWRRTRRMFAHYRNSSISGLELKGIQRSYSSLEFTQLFQRIKFAVLFFLFPQFSMGKKRFKNRN